MVTVKGAPPGTRPFRRGGRGLVSGRREAPDHTVDLRFEELGRTLVPKHEIRPVDLLRQRQLTLSYLVYFR